MGSNFVQGCLVTRLLSGFEEGCDAVQEGYVVVVIPCTAYTRMGVMVTYCLKARHRVCEDSQPFVLRKYGKSRVYCDEFCPHDGACLLRPRCIYVDGCGGGYVDHRRT